MCSFALKQGASPSHGARSDSESCSLIILRAQRAKGEKRQIANKRQKAPLCDAFVNLSNLELVAGFGPATC